MTKWVPAAAPEMLAPDAAAHGVRPANAPGRRERLPEELIIGQVIPVAGEAFTRDRAGGG